MMTWISNTFKTAQLGGFFIFNTEVIVFYNTYKRPTLLYRNK